MKITIKDTSREIYLTIQIENQTSIEDIKKTIENHANVPVNEQILFYTQDGQVTQLVNRAIVGDYPDVINDQCIYLSVQNAPLNLSNENMNKQEDTSLIWIIHEGSIDSLTTCTTDCIYFTKDLKTAFWALNEKYEAADKNQENLANKRYMIAPIELSNSRLIQLEESGKQFATERKYGLAASEVQIYVGFNTRGKPIPIEYNLLGYFSSDGRKFTHFNEPINSVHEESVKKQVISVLKQIVFQNIEEDRTLVFNEQRKPLITISKDKPSFQVLSVISFQELSVLYKYGFNPTMLTFLENTIDIPNWVQPLKEKLLPERLKELFELCLSSRNEDQFMSNLDEQPLTRSQRDNLLTIFSYYHACQGYIQHIQSKCGEITSPKKKQEWQCAFIAYLECLFPNVQLRDDLKQIAFAWKKAKSKRIIKLDVEVSVSRLSQLAQSSVVTESTEEEFDKISLELLTTRLNKDEKTEIFELARRNGGQTISDYWEKLDDQGKRSFFKEPKVFDDFVDAFRNPPTSEIVLLLDIGGVLDGRGVFKNTVAKQHYIHKYKELLKSRLSRDKQEEIQNIINLAEKTPVFDSEKDYRMPESVLTDEGLYSNVLCDVPTILTTLFDLKKLGCSLASHSSNSLDHQIETMDQLKEMAIRFGLPPIQFEMICEPGSKGEKYKNVTPEDAKREFVVKNQDLIRVYRYGNTIADGKCDLRFLARREFPCATKFYVLDDGLSSGKMVNLVRKEKDVIPFPIGSGENDYSVSDAIKVIFNEVNGKTLNSTPSFFETLTSFFPSFSSDKVAKEESNQKLTRSQTNRPKIEIVTDRFSNLSISQRNVNQSNQGRGNKIDNYQNNRPSLTKSFFQKNSGVTEKQAIFIINSTMQFLELNMPDACLSELYQLNLEEAADKKIYHFFKKLFDFHVNEVKTNQNSNFCKATTLLFSTRFGINKPFVVKNWNPVFLMPEEFNEKLKEWDTRDFSFLSQSTPSSLGQRFNH